MKAGREHRVPLSDRARDILTTLLRVGELRILGAAGISDRAMRDLLRAMRDTGATVHGFRSTFRDWAAETTAYSHELCEVALAHQVGDATERAYARGDQMEKRRRLMADWATFCGQPSAARGDVVPIRAAAQ